MNIHGKYACYETMDPGSLLALIGTVLRNQTLMQLGTKFNQNRFKGL